MRISIKTAEEFHDSHVTIEIQADDHAEVEDISKALSSSASQDARILELNTTINALRNRIINLEADRAAARELAEKNKAWAERTEANLDAEIAELETVKAKWREYVELGERLADQRDEARKRAEQAEAELTRTLDTSQYYVRTMDGLKVQLAEIEKIVNHGDVTSAFNHHAVPPYVTVLKTAIFRVRQALQGAPSKDTLQA